MGLPPYGVIRRARCYINLATFLVGSGSGLLVKKVKEALIRILGTWSIEQIPLQDLCRLIKISFKKSKDDVGEQIWSIVKRSLQERKRLAESVLNHCSNLPVDLVLDVFSLNQRVQKLRREWTKLGYPSMDACHLSQGAETIFFPDLELTVRILNILRAKPSVYLDYSVDLQIELVVELIEKIYASFFVPRGGGVRPKAFIHPAILATLPRLMAMAVFLRIRPVSNLDPTFLEFIQKPYSNEMFKQWIRSDLEGISVGKRIKLLKLVQNDPDTLVEWTTTMASIDDTLSFSEDMENEITKSWYEVGFNTWKTVLDLETIPFLNLYLTRQEALNLLFAG